ncbi:hypothetical protein Tco_1006683 [Tanacetum coccineum]|uniref:Uncharacterized protein n=1 Tax=Tanacetum coccineum TaxID=301880 RepID=A0ABQ5FJM9_9ASTR
MSLGDSGSLDLPDTAAINPALEATSLPMFDMHLYRSSLTETNVKWLTKCYGIPEDLHPRVPPEGMTMDVLLAEAIGLYAHHFQQGGKDIKIPSTSQNRAKNEPKTDKELGKRTSTSEDTRGAIKSGSKPSRNPIPKPDEYNASDVTKLREVVIPLRKPPPSILYVAGLSNEWKHAGRAFSIKDSNGEEDIPPKTGDMMVAELPYRKVLDDKEGKKRKAEEKAAIHVQAEKVVKEKDVREGVRKKRRVRVVNLDQTVTSLVTPPVVNVGEFPTGGEDGQDGADVMLANKGHGDNEGGISGLQTQPSPARHAEFFNEGVRHESAVRRSWKMLCQSAQQQANVLLRFESLMKEHADLEVLEDVEPVGSTASESYDEKYWRATNYPRIMKGAVDSTRRSSHRQRVRVGRDKREAEHLTSKQADREMVRRRIINQYLPTFVRRLHQSVEYKRSLGEAFSLAVDTFMETYEKLFDKRYPYVDKVARMYLLDPSGLQNVMSDETGPTPGGGPHDTPIASYS